MNTLLQERIRKDFPNIKWEGPAMQRDIECGTGWGLLVYAFLQDATKLCSDAGGTLIISQIKNKFGRLHLYCHQRGGTTATDTKKEYVPEQFGKLTSFRPYPANPTLRTLVEFYEQTSPHICELCGKAGHIDADVSPWLAPLCHPHALLIQTSRLRDDPGQFEEIDRDATQRIIERIDELKKDKAQA